MQILTIRFSFLRKRIGDSCFNILFGTYKCNQKINRYMKADLALSPDTRCQNKTKYRTGSTQRNSIAFTLGAITTNC